MRFISRLKTLAPTRFKPSAMNKIFLSSLLLASTTVAQDVIWGMGFSRGGDPTVTDSPNPMHRFKDLNGDGLFTDNEAFPLVDVDFTASSNTFCPDMGWAFENGRLTWYWIDSDNNECYIVRGQDLDNNGIIQAGEAAIWFSGTGYYRDPEAMAVTQVNGNTVVYISNTESNTVATDLGIRRLEDVDGNGTVDFATENTAFVNAAAALTVPSRTGGTVTITGENFLNLRTHPDGSLLAFLPGGFVNSILDPNTGVVTGYTTNPDTFVWYRFTDNGAGSPATASIFLNMSALNDVEQLVDFANGTLPPADINPSFGTGVVAGPNPTNGWNNWTFLGIDPGAGFGLSNVYYFGNDHRTTTGQGLVAPGTTTFGPVPSGCVFRAEDINFNGTIDAGELTVWANNSLGAYGGLPPANAGQEFGQGVWDMDARNSTVTWSHDEEIVTFRDDNLNGVIDSNEINTFQPDTTQGSSLFYGNSFGPFIDGARAFPSNTMAGPFPNNITPTGDGCASPNTGRVPQLDALGDASIGSTLNINALNVGTSFNLAFLVYGFSTVSVPVLPGGCSQFTSAEVTFSAVFPTPDAIARFNVNIPNDVNLVGFTSTWQCGFIDTLSPAGRPPFYLTNGLVITIQ